MLKLLIAPIIGSFILLIPQIPEDLLWIISVTFKGVAMEVSPS